MITERKLYAHLRVSPAALLTPGMGTWPSCACVLRPSATLGDLQTVRLLLRNTGAERYIGMAYLYLCGV